MMSRNLQNNAKNGLAIGDHSDGANSRNSLGQETAPSLSRSEVNQLIMEYLVAEGYQDAAEKFADETGLTLGSGLNSIQDRMRIREAVIDRRIDDVIDMVNRLWPELFDKNPVVYFKLRQTQMLEMIRCKQIVEALDFSQRYLCDLVEQELCRTGSLVDSSACSSEIVHDLENTMSLLAFENPADSVYSYLLESSQVEKVAGKLNRAILQEEHEMNGGQHQLDQDGANMFPGEETTSEPEDGLVEVAASSRISSASTFRGRSSRRKRRGDGSLEDISVTLDGDHFPCMTDGLGTSSGLSSDDMASIPRLTQMMGLLVFCKNNAKLSRKVEIPELWPTDNN